MHGSSANLWDLATTIDVFAGRNNLDFGTGFYSFRADAQGIKLSNTWANKSAQDNNGVGFLLIFSVKNQTWNNYTKKDYGTRSTPAADFVGDVNYNRSLPRHQVNLYGKDVVFGPTAKVSSGTWVANPDLPEQYKFETVEGINLVAVLPATSNFELA